MKLRNYILGFLAVSGVLTVVSCTDTPGIATCEKMWLVLKNQAGATAAVQNSALEMYKDTCKKGAAASVYRLSPSGDFTAIAHFSDFNPATGNGGFAQMVASDPLQPDSGIILCGIGANAISALVGNHTPDIKTVSGTSGIMTISRIGNKVTATMQVGGITASSTQTFHTAALNLGFQIGSNLDDLTGKLGIRILDIKVTGPFGTFYDEKFDCNNLR